MSKEINKYENGYTIEISYDNVYILKQFSTPCFISFKNKIFELHNDFIVFHKNENKEFIYGENMKKILPQLLENGKMLPKQEEGINNNVLSSSF